MSGHKWSDDEVKGLLDALKRNTTVEAALQEHNAKWKNHRTKDGVDAFMRARNIMGGFSAYLKKASAARNFASVSIKEQALDLIRRKVSFKNLCNALKAAPFQVEQILERLRNEGHEFKEEINGNLSFEVPEVKPNKAVFIPIRPVRDKIRIGIMSDIHIGSKQSHRKAICDFVLACYQRGIRHIFIPGDLTDGCGVYDGQEMDSEYNSRPADVARFQVNLLCEMLPIMKGLKYYFILGNHDLSFYKKVGLDVGKMIIERRSDMIYLGKMNGDCVLGKIKIRLQHGIKGASYAADYRMRKYVEAITPGSKPHVYLLGHYHTEFETTIRNVRCYQMPSFCGPTTFTKGMGVDPVIGGKMVTLGLDEKGSIRFFASRFYQYHYAEGFNVDE